MKKIILSSLALFGMMSANAQNALCVDPVKAAPGEEVTATLNLVNDFQCFGINFDMLLPEGVTVKKNSRGKFVMGTSLSILKGEGERSEYAFDYVANGNISLQNGLENLRFAASGSDYIEEGEGAILTIQLCVAETVAPGVYPIHFSGVKAIDQTTLVGITQNTSFDSYIVVGDAANAEVALTNVLPSFVNDALASETAISKLDLTGVTAAYGTFAYVDGREVVAPEGVTVEKATYTRAAGTSEYASLCLPFGAELNAYALASSSDVEAVFDETGVVAAGESYLVDGTAAINVEAANVALASAENKDVTSGVYLKGGKLWSVNESATIPAFRGCWDIAAGANLRIVVNGTTGINALEAESADKAFDLQGRRVQNAKSGVYVVNGKKQIVK